VTAPLVNDQALLDVLERLRSRFYGKYRGSVTDVDDDTLRIKAKVPAVLGEQKTGWCMPCVPYAGPGAGFAFIPEVGSGVWIEFEAGDVSYPIWSGCYWRSGEKPDDAKPAVKTIVSKSGLKILLDDDDGKIEIADTNDNTITLDASGLTIAHGSSKKIEITDSAVKVNDGNLEVT
jgi:uncharacterized protein involved in type VI secretion and phage assembly